MRHMGKEIEGNAIFIGGLLNHLEVKILPVRSNWVPKSTGFAEGDSKEQLGLELRTA